MDVQRSESDLRAHLAVATIGGACRHPGQTSYQAQGTSYKTTFVLVTLPSYNTFSWMVVKIYFHVDFLETWFFKVGASFNGAPGNCTIEGDNLQVRKTHPKGFIRSQKPGF